MLLSRGRPRILIVPSVITLLGGALVAAGSLGGTDRLEPSEQALAGDYAALGDSFSSGGGSLGAGDDSPCRRSDDAYTQRVADLPFDGDTRIVTCSGARNEDVVGAGRNGEAAQIDAVDADTSLVTIGISGNDAGWSSVMATCLLQDVDRCRADEDEVRERLAEAADGAGEVYEAVREQAADDARIIVVGYPRFFPGEPTDDIEYEPCIDPPLLPGVCARFTPGEQRYLNELAHDFDEMLAERAAAAEVEFVDGMFDAFDDHELGTEVPFLNGLELGWPDCGGLPTSVGDLAACFVEDETFHPNAAGQQRMAELVVARIRHP